MAFSDLSYLLTDQALALLVGLMSLLAIAVGIVTGLVAEEVTQ